MHGGVTVKPFCISLCLFSIMFLFGARLTAAAPAGNAKPSITITSPRDGATIVGSNVTIHVSVANFKLVPPVILSPANWKSIPLLRGNQGHIHYVLDSINNFNTIRDAVIAQYHPFYGVSPGWHTVMAYLATSQHQHFPGTNIARARVFVRATMGTPRAPVLRLVTLPRPGGGGGDSAGR